MSRNSSLIFFLLLAASKAFADTPAFDRPGIAFSTQTLPAGTVAWEQGLPDVVHDNQDGTDLTLYSADTRIRVGLTPSVELQIADALYNEQRTEAEGVITHDHGYGDLTVSIKLSLPPTQRFSYALLGSVSLANGQQPFTNGAQQYSVAGSISWHLDDDHSIGFYAGAMRSGDDNIYTLSPNFGWSLTSSLSAYVEAGYTFGDHIDKNEVAGGGLAWMVSNTVQLDIYGLGGLTAASTNLQAGFGVSVFFP
jgi:hypothetical protein